MAKNYNASENSTNKNSYGSNKNAYAENASGKNQSNKNSGNKNASGKNTTNRNAKNAYESDRNAYDSSKSITKVISIKKCKAVKNGKAAVWIPLLFCFWCSNLVPKKIVVQAHYLTKGNRKT